MKRIRTLLRGPVETMSGYGVHTRQLFEALVDDPMFDLHVESCSWGSCSYLTDYPLKQKVKKCIEKYALAKHQKLTNWDLYITVTIPNEFKKEGQINVGVSAMCETDRVSHEWIEKCNEMDLMIVPSNHSATVLKKTTVEWLNQRTNERGEIKFNKPLYVCHEGVDTSTFHKFSEKEKKEHSASKISSLKFASKFNFLCVGQWGSGGYGEDRKNIANTVKYFIEEFKGQKDVGLVLKTNMAKNSVKDREVILQRLGEIKSNYKTEEVPPIFLVHGSLTDQEMAELYNHQDVKAMISFTAGEGFGLPLLEAAACDLPIIATNWSGHLDFLERGKFSAVKYELKDIPDVAVWEPILIKGSMWAKVDEGDSKHRMRKIISSYSTPCQWAKELGKEVRKEYDKTKTNAGFSSVIKSSLKKLDAAAKIDPVEHLRSFVDTPDDYNVIFTMPMSTGDVFVSTAVLDGLVKELPKNAKIYYATDPKYVDILVDNPHVYKVLPWNQTMMQTDLLEEVFDLALMPNVATQLIFSNYVRRGQGRLLAEEYANYCMCELGDYFIKKDDSVLKSLVQPDVSKYVTIHPGSGKGQWEARKYIEWDEVVKNLKSLYPAMKVVQVGSSEETLIKHIDVDLRGKTDVHQLASVVEGSDLHLSIDTFTMHLAAAFDTPVVALFGSSHAMSSGPWVRDRKKSKIYLLEAENKLGCNKACYKYQCKKNQQMPCINEISPNSVVEAAARIVDKEADGPFERIKGWKYEPIYDKISGYSTAYNCEKLGIPYLESIKSMLGFCDEVVVVDGCSNDGTYEKLEELAEKDDRLRLYQNEFDWNLPSIDGSQKAFARALCEHEYVWQQDLDEVVHEDDYEKIKAITKRFPTNVDVLHLPMVELWGDIEHATYRRHVWKYRLSRNKPEITHGINKDARLVDEKTGCVYAKQGMSDGCEYVNVMNYEMVPHDGFYNQQIEIARKHMPEQFAQGINQVYEQIPSVWHTSWLDIENKINQLKKGGTWDKLWSLLYQTESQERFPGITTPEQVSDLAEKLRDQGGEDSDEIKGKFKLTKEPPALLKAWAKRRSKSNE